MSLRRGAFKKNILKAPLNFDMKKIQGVSLIESLVAVVILSLTIGGMANLFIASSRWLLAVQTNLVAEEYGRLFLDPLQMQVRQDTWDNVANGLTVTAPTAGPSLTIDKITYSIIYEVQSTNNVRKVKAIINWTEPAIF